MLSNDMLIEEILIFKDAEIEVFGFKFNIQFVIYNITADKTIESGFIAHNPMFGILKQHINTKLGLGTGITSSHYKILEYLLNSALHVEVIKRIQTWKEVENHTQSNRMIQFV